MTIRNQIAAGLSAVGFLVLILDGQTAMQGAAVSIDWCIRAVIPSLFPFLFLSSMITAALWGRSNRWIRFWGKHTGIPSGGESLLLTALLGGYPAGAKAVGDACRDGRLSADTGTHLLRFCSNAGPAFIFGILSMQFPKAAMLWALWIIQILSSLTLGISRCPVLSAPATFPEKTSSISQILAQSVKTMALICGWILLFGVLNSYLTRWFIWYFPPEVQVIMGGLLELTNGCLALNMIGSVQLRFVICSALLSFGGICIMMQTASVIGPLPLKPYIIGKIGQMGISILLSWLYLSFGWIVLGVYALFLFLFPGIQKKVVAFRQPKVYNATIMTERNQNHAVS